MLISSQACASSVVPGLPASDQYQQMGTNGNNQTKISSEQGGFGSTAMFGQWFM